MRVSKLKPSVVLLLFSTLLSVAAFYLCFGTFQVVIPSYYAWMLRGDWSFMLMGWNYFQKQGFAWPFTAIEGYLYPLHINLYTADIIPWWSLLLKVPFQFVPTPNQHFGLWFLFCFIMQGYFAYRIGMKAFHRNISRVALIILCLFCPAFFLRIGHPALCAHWLILAAFSRSLDTKPIYCRRELQKDCVLLAIATATHPYFIPMIGTILIVKVFYRYLKFQEVDRRKILTMELGSLLLSLFGTAFVFGLLGNYRKMKGPIDIWTADVLTFIQPKGNSSWIGTAIPDFGNGEGYAYLGLGVIAAVLICCILILKQYFQNSILSKSHHAYRILFLAASILAFWSFGEKVRWADHKIMSVHHLYQPFYSSIAVYRAAGRFIWPLMYFIVLFSIFQLERILKNKVLHFTILTGLLLLQMTDERNILHTDAPIFAPISYNEVLWKNVGKTSEILALVPPNIENTMCSDINYPPGYYQEIGLVALRLGLKFNSGNSANPPNNVALDYCKSFMDDEVKAKNWRRDTLYIVAPFYRDQLDLAKLSCSKIDGFEVCRNQSAME